eukprot:TRINITY_DN3257_c0_g1_i2.p1 TRINITY_DN3257_c0_g1~~TRINITY_DN3257_c0_g1_i2.p1  ORF type:complete len:364 (-),score=73.84 TRINITY_DN3257_c0_g1_i2:1067-2158(-)
MADWTEKLPQKPDENSTFPSDLFTKDGKPLEFYMAPNRDKERIRKIVTKGGGIMRAGYTTTCITLSPADMLQTAPADSTSTAFIDDSAINQALQDVGAYRLSVLRQKAAASLPAVATTQPLQARKGRLKYTDEEDLAIINYVSRPGVSTSGVMVWKEMEAKQITLHTWQSMRDRYLKVLVPKGISSIVNKTTKRASVEPVDATQPTPPSAPIISTPVASTAATAITSATTSAATMTTTSAATKSAAPATTAELASKRARITTAQPQPPAPQPLTVPEAIAQLRSNTGCSQDEAMDALIRMSGRLDQAILLRQQRVDELIFTPWSSMDDEGLNDNMSPVELGRVEWDVEARKQFLSGWDVSMLR